MKKKNEINQNFLKKVFFTHLGRDAIYECMKILNLNAENKILLPSYVGLSPREGSGVFDPVVKLKAGYDFYTMNENLSANLADLEKKLAHSEIKAMLLIHYFGFCTNDMEKIVDLCKKYDVALIEDCAHTLNSIHQGTKLGTYGEFSIFAINKILPITTGGFLQINSDNYSVQNIIESIDVNSLACFVRYDLEKASEVRKKNYLYTHKKLEGVKGVKAFYPVLPEGITPLNYPLLILEKDRNKVYFALEKEGIETSSLYHTLIAPISKEEYPLSHTISKQILNIPIHEGVSFEDINKTIEALRRII